MVSLVEERQGREHSERAQAVVSAAKDGTLRALLACERLLSEGKDRIDAFVKAGGIVVIVERSGP